VTVLIIVGVVFGAAVLALLIYGIVTHKTRALEGDAGTLDELKFAPDWVPLTLIIDTELSELEDHVIGAVKIAAAWWEEETGRRYFVPPGELELQGHVVPILEAPEGAEEEHSENAVAYVDPRINHDGFLASAAVYLLPSWRGRTTEQLAQIFKHELGHCLGLAHDEDARSIMYGTLGSRGQFVSPNDMATLLELYPELPDRRPI
jgi:hypothetical protein